MAYDVNGTTVEHDEEGYITNLADWTKELADVIAEAEEIDMNEEHWAVVNFLREYYDEYQIAPAVRVLIKAIKKRDGTGKRQQQVHVRAIPIWPCKASM